MERSFLPELEIEMACGCGLKQRRVLELMNLREMI